jgi:hypothetical protein
MRSSLKVFLHLNETTLLASGVKRGAERLAHENSPLANANFLQLCRSGLQIGDRKHGLKADALLGI